MLFRLRTLVILSKKLTRGQRLVKLKKINHDKYIITQKFNKLAAENFAGRLKQANLASKNDIADFASKTRHVEFKNKLDDLSEKNKLISTTGLTKGLINNYSFLIGEKYFGESGSQNYLVFQSFSRYFTTTKNKKLVRFNLKEHQEKILHLHLQKTLVLNHK